MRNQTMDQIEGRGACRIAIVAVGISCFRVAVMTFYLQPCCGLKFARIPG
ncbi:hypothetical protein LP7551_02602 [Roseibium album]|nr:hypothetical protein LP7551_02602 [Roseibium album]